MNGPTIAASSVVLRSPRSGDAERLVRWLSDPRVTSYLPTRHPPTVDREIERLEEVARDPNQIYWIVEADGRPIGTTSIHQIDWRHGWGFTGTLIGEREWRGRGLGREAMRLRTAYAFREAPFRKLKASYVDGNEASARSLASVGYRAVGRYRDEWFSDGRWHDVVLTEILRGEWEGCAKQQHLTPCAPA